MTTIQIYTTVPPDAPVWVEVNSIDGNQDEQAFAQFLTEWLRVFADQVNEHRLAGEPIATVINRMMQSNL